MNIGKNIKRLRENREITQSELAKLLDVSDKTVSSWEMNRTEPKMGMVQKLCGVLNCRVSEIIDVYNDNEYYEAGEPSYYHDPEVARYVDMLHKSEGQRILLDASKDLNMEDLKFLATMAEKMRGNNNDDTGC